MYNVLLLGITGVGKSQLCNYLYEDLTNSKYKVGNSNKSETNIKDLILNEEKNIPPLDGKFNLIDSPGGDDSKNNDIKNLEELVKFLKKKGKVHCIILVFNYATRNESTSVKEYLNKLSSIFTPIEFYNHCCVVLTNFPLDPTPDDELKRKTYMDEMNALLRNVFKIKDETVKKDYYFIDSKRCYNKKTKDYYYKDEQNDNRIAIIKEINRICQGYNPININFVSFVDARDKRYKIDDYYYYKIKGSYEGQIWGNGIYTDDSNISKAAIFEGICKYGEEKLIKIKMVKGLSYYPSSYKNGINSSSWNSWPASYIFIK